MQDPLFGGEQQVRLHSCIVVSRSIVPQKPGHGRIDMKVLVAGATGALGVPLVRALIADGHQVLGLTRTPDNAGGLSTLGAQPVDTAASP